MGHIVFEDFKRLVRQLHGSHVLYKPDPVLEQICELNELLLNSVFYVLIILNWIFLLSHVRFI